MIRGAMSAGMTPEQLADKLTTIPMFSDVDLDSARALAGIVQYRKYRKGDVLTTPQDEDPCMYLLLSGRVKVTLTSPDGKELALSYLEAPDHFGELSLGVQHPRLPSVVALTDLELFALRASDMEEAFRLQPRLAISLIATLSQRLRSTVTRLEDMAFSDATQRVTRVLLNIATAGLETRGAPVIQGMTHYEIATLAGTSRETASRVISALGREGVLASRGRRITVDIPKLSAKLESA